MHTHNFRLVSEDRKNKSRVYQCECGYTLEERKTKGNTFYYFVVSKEIEDEDIYN